MVVCGRFLRLVALHCVGFSGDFRWAMVRCGELVKGFMVGCVGFPKVSMG